MPRKHPHTMPGRLAQHQDLPLPGPLRSRHIDALKGPRPICANARESAHVGLFDHALRNGPPSFRPIDRDGLLIGGGGTAGEVFHFDSEKNVLLIHLPPSPSEAYFALLGKSAWQRMTAISRYRCGGFRDHYERSASLPGFELQLGKALVHAMGASTRGTSAHFELALAGAASRLAARP